MGLCERFDNWVMYFHFRLTVTAQCAMDLTFFPMDSQICSLEIESCENWSFESFNFQNGDCTTEGCEMMTSFETCWVRLSTAREQRKGPLLKLHWFCFLYTKVLCVSVWHEHNSHTRFSFGSASISVVQTFVFPRTKFCSSQREVKTASEKT